MKFEIFGMSGPLATLCLSSMLTLTVPETARAEPPQSIRITLVLPATGTQFGDRLRYGAEAAAATFNGKVKLKVVGPAHIDPGQQVNAFQNEMLSAPDAIIVGPIPAALFVEPAKLAEEQGIKVSWIVVPPTADIGEALFVGNNEFEMGERVGNLIADRIEARKGKDPTGVVVPGTCFPGLTNLEDRLAGVKAILGKRLPNVKLNEPINTGNDRSAKYAAWDQALQSSPSGLAFYDVCEPGMINLTKLKEDDKRNFDLVVWDTPSEVLQGLENGTIASAVPPSHFISSYVSVYLIATALLEGKPIPQGWLRTPERAIDEKNIKEFALAESSEATMLSFFKTDIDKLIAELPDKLPSVANSYR